MDTPHSDDLLDALDVQELFMLGLRASTTGDSGAALGYLKRAIAKDLGHAQAHWTLAAEYAALRMPERAVEHFARAVELDPHQPVARFQYGLLRLTSGDIAQAEAIWAPLDELPSGHPVLLFKQGLLHMVRNEFVDALRALRSAAADAGVDPALRKDIETTIARIETVEAEGTTDGPSVSAAAATAAQPADVTVQSHLALTAYATGSRRH